jgi:hypothetical protein
MKKIAFLFLLILLIIYLSFNHLSRKTEFNNINELSPKSIYIILYWTKFNLQKHASIGNTSEGLKCNLKHTCVFTDDQKAIPNSSAVIFHWYDLIVEKGVYRPWEQRFPQYRREDQRWILFTIESPVWYGEVFNPAIKNMNNLFNWTMTYRKDSDIYAPYGNIHPTSTENLLQARREINFSNKTKQCAWIVSHCQTEGKREEYVKELQKFIKVDIYGNCAPHKEQCLPYQSDECYKRIEKEYKFYLSFENGT